MDDYPFLEIFWTMFVFFLWIIWLTILFRVFADIFRSHDLGGWGKAGWTLLVIVLPFLGVFVYILARGGGMAEREMERERRIALKTYTRHLAAESTPSNHADALATLADLKNHHEITEEEYQRAKEQVLAA